MKKTVNIAIDGPAGAGKSTIAKMVSKRLGYIYVDTGAMYRTMGLYLLENHIKADDIKSIEECVDHVDIDIRFVDGEQRLYLNGTDVTDRLRTEEVGNMASASSVHMPIRNKLVELQKKIATEHDVVMDGRDIGTCVLPQATAKIYLTASVEVRAHRRYKELIQKGVDCDIEEIKKDIEERDYRDMHRENSPLKRAEDAVMIDSSDMNIEEVVEEIIKISKEQ